jgi:outer membrane protein assembly factor BamB
MLWRSEVAVPPLQVPLAGISKGILWEYLTDRLVGLNARTNEKLWERSDLELEFVGPKIKATRAFGELLIVKSPKARQISGISLSDGKTAWAVSLRSEQSYHLVSNDMMIVFEPDSHVFAVDLETGKSILDLPIKQNPRPQPRGLITVSSLVAGNTLFFQSVEGEVIAVNLAPAAAERTLWRTRISSRIKGFQEGNARLFAATENGDLIALDAKSGTVIRSERASEKDLDIDFLNDRIAVVSSVEALSGYDPATLEKKWQFPLNGPTKKPVYLNNAVVVQSSVQLSAFDVETGTLLWQYAANQLAAEPELLQTVSAGLASVFVTKDSLFLLSRSGVKEYSVERAPREGVTEKEVLAELASALLAKGALEEATSYANRIAQEIDANYAPLRYLQARLDQARGDTAAAREKLASYVTLVGRQSRAGQDVLLELRRDAGLRWDSEVGAALANSQPLLLDNKLVNISRTSGSDSQIVAIDPNTGRILWRQNAERFLDMTYDVKSRRIYYARGLNSDPTAVLLYSIELSSGDRKELARIAGALVIGRVALGFANSRVFLGSVSSDISTQRASIRLQAFNAGSGKKLWEKSHESQGNMLDFLGSPLGLFEPHGDYFGYSFGREVWIVRGEDGTIDGELHEAYPLLEQWRRIDTASQDADLIYFNSSVGSVQVLAFYSISAKKVLRRTPRFLLKMDSGTVACVAGNECGFRGETLLVNEGTAVALLDTSDDALAIPTKWRVQAANGKFLAAFPEGDVVWVTRSDAVALKLDRASGRMLNEYSYSRLWRSSALLIENGRGYVYTPDGLAFSFELKATK